MEHATMKNLEDLIKDSNFKSDNDSSIGITGYLDSFEGELKSCHGVDESGRKFLTVGPFAVSGRDEKANNRFFRIFQRYSDSDSILVTTGNDSTGDGPVGGAVTKEEFEGVRALVLNGRELVQGKKYFTPQTWNNDEHHCPTCKAVADMIIMSEGFCNECYEG